ncbi:MAG: OmpH family outer membrane protein [Cellulophaga sp.]|uniref:OmpH family outer membrane protein n=1 Tax=unclassified Cellulophaga TaxID=2634405 RepID=UPI000C2C64B7|nr:MULTISPECIES: OmpH family outer membrane protein [unclassified Cellulophaga]MDO6490358.1 OmpH family outer membrane protein [Cellulophaga sp. 2_MG-2023]MDO6494448.1 OmpH family outer membrane protein [Cellulophaga sp. 3_MG-2023]PKB42035.1 periplasmic chaperone for outer membrane proteins Skp [Cellulophaga sp. RHA19]|eukprot:TRINITY_DN12416_c0_g1_i1.p2 TRINITY_DN12416_c0_g1~~TRINITY_DN12416_c0_g1_i1.p2  ORF type:complete len:170 (+),score=40.10 TRINITY_DN12416_c0_g1_i1:844-1353(+)
MKHLKKIAVALVLFVATTAFVNAQSKVAHINVQQLLQEMPAMKSADAELKKLNETLGADIQASMAEARNKATQYQNEAASKTAEENAKREQEIMTYQKTIQTAQQAAQQELQKKQQELLAPIQESAMKAIEKVAAAQGFDYVIDASPGAGLLVSKGKDLLADVKKELKF